MPSAVSWLIVPALLVAGGCGRVRSEPAPIAVAAEAWAHGVGYIEPVSELRRLAFKHPGVIAVCRVAVGVRVNAGEILATLRAEAEQAAVGEAESALGLARAELAQVRAGVNPQQIEAVRAAKNAAEAEARHARQELARQRALLAERAASPAEFAAAEVASRRADALAAQRAAELNHMANSVRETDLAVAEARVRVAEARLAAAREQMRETELRAPCGGMVLEWLQHAGEAATGGAPAVIFADPSGLQVRAEIDETQALALRPRQLAVVSGPALGGREISGEVRLVKALMGRKTVFTHAAAERKDLDVLEVFLELPPATELPLGLQVDVRVRTAGGPTPAASPHTFLEE